MAQHPTSNGAKSFFFFLGFFFVIMESIESIVKSQVSYLGKKNIFYLKIIILVFIFIFKISILKLSKIF
jgi:uncharacterized membrane protein